MLIHLCRSCSRRWSLRSRYRRHRPSGRGCSGRWCTGTGCWSRSGCSPLHRCRRHSRRLHTCQGHPLKDEPPRPSPTHTTYDGWQKLKMSSPESQCHCTLMHRPLEQLKWVRGSQVGKAELVVEKDTRQIQSQFKLNRSVCCNNYTSVN